MANWNIQKDGKTYPFDSQEKLDRWFSSENQSFIKASGESIQARLDAEPQPVYLFQALKRRLRLFFLKNS